MVEQTEKSVPRATLGKNLELAFPPRGDQLAQDEEWVVVNTADGWRKIRLHDYHEVFSVPGLYERWVYDILGCKSPAKIAELLGGALQHAGVDPASLRVLDLGAGNGCVAEELSHLGIASFVGADILHEARDAARRDRPGMYDEFVVGDLTNLPADEQRTLDSQSCNCLACVAALGFGDIPVEVFAEAFNHIEAGGWIAFTVKVDFLSERDVSGFSRLIRAMMADGVLEVAARGTYQHRLSTDGTALEYEAFIGRKRGDITLTHIEDATT